MKKYSRVEQEALVVGAGLFLFGCLNIVLARHVIISNLLYDGTISYIGLVGIGFILSGLVVLLTFNEDKEENNG